MSLLRLHLVLILRPSTPSLRNGLFLDPTILLQENAMNMKVGAVLRRQLHCEPQKTHVQHPPDAYHLPDDEPKPQLRPVCAG
jgi:hypothetical protein